MKHQKTSKHLKELFSLMEGEMSTDMAAKSLGPKIGRPGFQNVYSSFLMSRSFVLLNLFDFVC